MKFKRLYANRSDTFRPIVFNEGLNVIYGKVKKPKDSSKHSHNLGKTLLIELLDFMLLKTLRKGHFLYDQKKLFHDFVFFLEVDTGNGSWITIRRSVENPTKIAFFKSNTTQKDLTQVSLDRWERPNAFKTAVDWLNEHLALDLGPWNYRKGVGYFLRSQYDYQDVFQLYKHQRNKDKDWKPFLAFLLGFDYDVIEQKYEQEAKLLRLEQRREDLQQDAGEDAAYDRLKAQLDLDRMDLDEARQEIEHFDFYKPDMDFNTELVEQVERDIADLNERLYVLDFEIEKARPSLETGSSFDLDKVTRLFKEANIAFPGQLERNYRQLIDFQEKLSKDRNRYLEERLAAMEHETEEVREQLETLNSKRAKLMGILRESDTLDKFRSLQKTLIEKEAEIIRLEMQLEVLNKKSLIDREIQEQKVRLDKLGQAIEEEIRRENPLYTGVRTRFAQIIRQVLGLKALIYISQNKRGNPEFYARYLSETETATAEDKGTSFKQLLCSAFDMALLMAHADRPFYRFVYHDGALERLDHRKKLRFLEQIRNLCDRYGIQYILTVIDSDIPRDADDKRRDFSEEEIVLPLHDDGDDGRLFRMAKF